MSKSNKPFDAVAYHRQKLRGEVRGEDWPGAWNLKHAIDNRHRQTVLDAIARDPELTRRAFDYYGDTVFHRSVKAFDENALLWMLQNGAPILAPADRKLGTPFDQMQHYGKSTDDLIGDLNRKLIIPAAILEAQEMPRALRPRITEPSPFENNRYYFVENLTGGDYHLRNVLFSEPTAKPRDYRGMKLDELRRDPYVRQFFRPMRLTRTWDSHVVTMPMEMTPYRTIRHWQPLLKEDFITESGHRITCLTDSRQLNQEGIELQHCVGKSTYDIKCCGGEFRSHILSIHDAAGNPLSTAEVQYYPATKNYEGDIEVAGTGYRMFVRQHHGQYNGTPTKEGKAALDAFIKALSNPEVAKRYFTDTPEALGEIEEKRESNAPSIVEEYTGFTPSWGHLERVFNEFRRAERRASTHYDENHRLIYDDAIDPEDPQQFRHSHHLIDGYVRVDANGQRVGKIASSPEQLEKNTDTRTVSLRDVGFKDWLNATGLRSRIHYTLGDDANLAIRRAEHKHKKENSKFTAKLGRLIGRRDEEAEQIEAMKSWLSERPHWDHYNDEPIGQHSDYQLSGNQSPKPEPRMRRRDWREALEPTSIEPASPYLDRNGR